MADLSTPLDKSTDATLTALGGDPIFVGNPHGVENGQGKTNGIGRWRDGFGAHAYAVLGLTVLEGTLGVLILEWPEPHPFEEEDRRNLQLFADVVATCCMRHPPGSLLISLPKVPKPACDDAELAAFQMNARGLVVPDAVAASWSEPAVVRVSTAVTPTQPEVGSVAFAEVAGAPGGGLLFAVGAVSAGTKGRRHRGGSGRARRDTCGSCARQFAR